MKHSYLNAGIKQEIYYYRDTLQKEIDMILVRKGTITCIEIKSGQIFSAADTQNFKELNQSQFLQGQKCLICTADDGSMLNDGTLVLPVSAI